MRMPLAFLTAMAAAAAAPAPAADAEAPPFDELDEVVVSGTRLEDRILALENSFYQLYNELNKDDQFDMFCTQIPERRNSPETVRACLPRFYADALSDSVVWHYRCQETRACYTPPDPTFVLFARNQELRNHMRKVINSDPRLKEMNEIRSELEIRIRTAGTGAQPEVGAAQDGTKSAAPADGVAD
jgi:hypothetical protein